MPLWDDLLIDGVSLPDGVDADTAEGLCVEGPWQFPFQSGEQRGDFPVYQGFDGSGYTDQPYASFVMPVYVTVSAPVCGDAEQSDETWAWLNNAIEQVRLVCKPDQLVTLTRRRSMPGGNDSHTTPAKLVKITANRVGRDTLRLVVEFLILDGVWYGAEVVESLASGAHSINVPGTSRTYAIEVAANLPNDTNVRTWTNTTNGYAFSYAPETPNADTTFDVPTRVATLDVGGADVSRLWSWAKQQPFRLDPGVNALVLGTAAVITYRPVYL